jgi:hypothetical protein
LRYSKTDDTTPHYRKSLNIYQVTMLFFVHGVVQFSE